MKIYFLGISGTFMGNLAQIAKAMGHEVFGCDNKVYPPMSDELNSSGINFFQGYEEKNIVDADIYVIGNAISKENNLLKEILRLEIETLYSFFLLFGLCEDRIPRQKLYQYI